MVSPELLKEQILLEQLETSELEKIAKIIVNTSFKKDEFIFRERDAAKGIYLINTGKVEISKNISEGWRQTLAILTPGHFCGELSIIEHRQHDANAIALEDTEILLIEKDDFERMESEDAALMSKIIKKLVLVLSHNLTRMNEKFLTASVSY